MLPCFGCLTQFSQERSHSITLCKFMQMCFPGNVQHDADEVFLSILNLIQKQMTDTELVESEEFSEFVVQFSRESCLFTLDIACKSCNWLTYKYICVCVLSDFFSIERGNPGAVQGQSWGVCEMFGVYVCAWSQQLSAQPSSPSARRTE